MWHLGRRARRYRSKTSSRFPESERLEARVVPAVITVMNTGDSGPGSLRAAITQADLDTTPDTIMFASSVTGTITLLSALPELSTAITLDGPGASVLTVAPSTATGPPDFGIFTVPKGADVTISGLTISGGGVNTAAAGEGGGGIFNAGTLTVTDSTITGNVASSGGGIDNTGTLTVTDSTISDNEATSSAAACGIANESGGTLTVTDSTISDNGIGFGGYGGGIDNAGTLTVTDSTITGNGHAFNNGGGIGSSGHTNGHQLHNHRQRGRPSGDGGGIDNSGSLTVTDSTLTGNFAEIGGGINNGGTLTVTGSLFDNLEDFFGTFISHGHNLFSDSPPDVFLAPTDLVNTNPLLGPLANHGGPTQTMALLPGSPAIGAGVAVAGITTDQRGIARPQGEAPDIGAFESQGFTLKVVPGSTPQSATGTPFAHALAVIMTANDPVEPVNGGVVRFVANPASNGASALLSASSAIITNGQAFVVAAPVNADGSYKVVASASGLPSTSFDLTNVGPVHTSLVVNTTVDSLTPGAGLLSLREAIAFANTDRSGRFPITFDPTVFASPQTITLTLGPLELSNPGEAETITGPPPGVTISGGGQSGVFQVDSGVTASISGLTISGGNVTSYVLGGGIDNSGTLTVTDSTISGNSAGFGYGGGIDNTGTLTVTDSTISGNSAGSGDGISNGGTLTVTNSTISGNSSGSGGGIDNAGTLTVTDSTLSGNSVGGDSDGGGGIFNTGMLTITMSLFANVSGGNVVSGGTPGSVVVSRGHNLFSDDPRVALHPVALVNTDLVNTDPLLGPLADYGGPTQTVALLPGSPAIDAGSAVAGVTTDERGIPRPQGSAPDIGAFESRGFTLALVSGNDQSTLTGSPFPVPLVVAVSSAFGEPVAGGHVTFSAPPTGPSATFTGNPATISAGGLASVHATANQLLGSYAVTARAAGADSVALTLINGGPSVVSLQRTGIHLQPTHLVLTFNRPMNAATVQDLRNYVLYPIGPNGYAGPNPQPIPIVSAVYDPTTRTVTLTTRSRLKLNGYYLLTVSGVGPLPVVDVNGDRLTGTGTGGLPGDYIALVHGFGPLHPAPSAAQALKVSIRARRTAFPGHTGRTVLNAQAARLPAGAGGECRRCQR